MRLSILAFGHATSAWAQAGIEEYTKRFPREWPLTIEVIKPEKRIPGKSITPVLATEAERLRKLVPKQSKVVLCDEHGESVTTPALAQLLERSSRTHAGLCFCIGSADGFDKVFKSEHDLISLSPLTMPHELARLLLVEQLYRSICILNHHPYHRE